MTKTFSPSEAAFSIFELAERQPQFVLRFCIIYALILMITYALAGATGVGQAMQNYIALTTGGRTPDAEKVIEVISPAAVGLIVVVAFGLITSAMTGAMALRKAVRDEESGLLGLQFGSDEIKLFIAMAIVVFGLLAINLTLSVLGGLVTAGNMGLALLVVSASVVITALVGLRFSQFGVLTIANHKVSVRESWTETKGQGLRFAGAYLLWLIIASIIGLIAQSLGGIAAGAMGVKVGVGMPASLGEYMKPGWLLYSLLYGLASGFGNLGMICIGAYAWHQMRGNLPAPKTVL